MVISLGKREKQLLKVFYCNNMRNVEFNETAKK